MEKSLLFPTWWFSKGNLQNSLHSDLGMNGNLLDRGPVTCEKTSANPALGKVDQTQKTEPQGFLCVFLFKFQGALWGDLLVRPFWADFLENKRLVSIYTSNCKFYNPFLGCFLVLISIISSIIQKTSWCYTPED